VLPASPVSPNVVPRASDLREARAAGTGAAFDVVAGHADVVRGGGPDEVDAAASARRRRETCRGCRGVASTVAAVVAVAIAEYVLRLPAASFASTR